VASVIVDLAKLPVGAHAVGFYASPQEASDHAAAFLAGTPKGQSAAFWVSTEALKSRFKERIAKLSPNAEVGVLPEGQVGTEGEKLRPVAEVTHFLGAHPEGVTAGADTLSDHLSAANVGRFTEYESWIDGQPHEHSRLLCPYDLRRLPPEGATDLVRGLGASHSHVALSTSEEPAMRLLQLFVFPTVQSVPEVLRDTIRWALSEGYVLADGSGAFDTTARGQRLISEWSHQMTGGT
jgi:hypothetical protein